MRKTEIKQAREVPLDALCLSIAQLYKRDPSLLDGARIAQLTHRLIAAESQPGGPYYGPHGTLDLPTNLAIGYLFKLFDKPLPNVATFIDAHRPNTSHPPAVARLFHKYDTALTHPSKKPSANAPHRLIFTGAKKQLSSLHQPEKSLATAFLRKIQQSDTNQEIALLPTFFANSLITPLDSPPLQQLGEANVFCWVAYSIYDDILDDEPAAQYLPIANIAMRLSIQKYQALLPSTHPLQQTILTTFTAMDHANAWEVINCRFKRVGESIIISALPTYGRNTFLAQRSVGHILGPLVLSTLAQLPNSAIHNIEKGLHHFLTARQLSDDLHDWKDDFHAGHACSVVTFILNHLHIQPDTYEFAPLLLRMQHDFWDHSMEAINSSIRRHLRLSRSYLLKDGYIKNDGELFALLSRLEDATVKSTGEHKRYQDFLASY